MGKNSQQLSVLFVCMGNICRSPLAEGVFKKKVDEYGLTSCLLSDSAGTHDYHIGHAPDERAILIAKEYGYDISQLRAREIKSSDFENFDYIFYMDEVNESMLKIKSQTLLAHRAQLYYLMDYAGFGKKPIKDPYYGDLQEFKATVELLEKAMPKIIERLGCELKPS